MRHTVEDFVAAARAALPQEGIERYKVRTYGGSKAMADIIIPLILAGEKTGTFALAACADGPVVVPLLGRTDLGALRRAWPQVQARAVAFRPDANADAAAAAYAAFPGFPLDCFSARAILEAAEGPALVRQHIARLLACGVLAQPGY